MDFLSYIKSYTVIYYPIV